MDDVPILICYDGSPGAERAIAAAASLLPNRRAIILDVAPPLTVAETYVALGPIPAELEDINLDSAHERAEAGATAARKAGLNAQAHAEIGVPTWDTVVEVANEIGAAAIVIGSRGLSGARELVQGSLSHEVAEHAGRPVLIVPPPRS
jgi:nucleotide-binding universal stress UspA family protein